MRHFGKGTVYVVCVHRTQETKNKSAERISWVGVVVSTPLRDGLKEREEKTQQGKARKGTARHVKIR